MPELLGLAIWNIKLTGMKGYNIISTYNCLPYRYHFDSFMSFCHGVKISHATVIRVGESKGEVILFFFQVKRECKRKHIMIGMFR